MKGLPGRKRIIGDLAVVPDRHTDEFAEERSLLEHQGSSGKPHSKSMVIYALQS